MCPHIIIAIIFETRPSTGLTKWLDWLTNQLQDLLVSTSQHSGYRSMWLYTPFTWMLGFWTQVLIPVVISFLMEPPPQPLVIYTLLASSKINCVHVFSAVILTVFVLTHNFFPGSLLSLLICCWFICCLHLCFAPILFLWCERTKIGTLSFVFFLSLKKHTEESAVLSQFGSPNFGKSQLVLKGLL